MSSNVLFDLHVSACCILIKSIWVFNKTPNYLNFTSLAIYSLQKRIRFRKQIVNMGRSSSFQILCYSSYINACVIVGNSESSWMKSMYAFTSLLDIPACIKIGQHMVKLQNLWSDNWTHACSWSYYCWWLWLPKYSTGVGI